MLDCLSSWVAEEHFDVLAQAGFRMRTGNNHERLVPFGTYECVDGHIAIAAVHRTGSPAARCHGPGRPAARSALCRPRHADAPCRPRCAGVRVDRDKTVAFVEQALVQERGVPAARSAQCRWRCWTIRTCDAAAITDLQTDGGTVRGMGPPIGFGMPRYSMYRPRRSARPMHRCTRHIGLLPTPRSGGWKKRRDLTRPGGRLIKRTPAGCGHRALLRVSVDALAPLAQA